MFLLLGLCVTLVSFLVTNVLASALVAVAAFPVLAHAAAPARRAERLLALRLLPALVALVVTATVVLPSYLLLEPEAAGESASAALLATAGAGLVVIVAAVWRGVAAAVSTRRLVRKWMVSARPVDLPFTQAPAYAFEHALPVVSLVGALKPRLFVAERVLAALSPEEMAAAVAHEAAHLSSRDNLKRWSVRVTPDLLAFFPLGGRIEREWVRASEAAADARAAGADRGRALDLGAALLKVAALAAGRRVDVLASALDDGGEIAARVRRLAEHEHGAAATVAPGDGSRRGAVIVAAAALVAAPLLWTPAHGVLEALVAFLR